MDYKEAAEVIRANWKTAAASFLTPAKKQGQFVCPFCGHGSHGDGITEIPPDKTESGRAGSLKCFGCNWSGDVIALYQEQGNADYKQAISFLSGVLGISLDAPESRKNADMKAAGNSAAKTQKIENKPDYTAYYKECAERLNQAADYITGRGISMETAVKMKWGYDPVSDPAHIPGGVQRADINYSYPEPRVIMPHTKSDYTARATGAESKYKKMHPHGAELTLYHKGALYKPGVQTVFLVEGEFDAASLIEIGREAVGLGSITQAAAFISQLEAKPTAATVVICLDNDAGDGAKANVKKAAATIAEGLKRLKISYTIADICGGYKDANEFIAADRAGFIKAVETAEAEAGPRPDNLRDYILSGRYSHDLDRYRKGGKPTGFKEWDKKTSGLHEGIFMLASAPGSGKSSLVYQIADYLAANGTECLFFSMEQTRRELLTKSISRRIKLSDPDTKIQNTIVREGAALSHYQALIEKTTEQTAAELGNRLSVIEGNFGYTAEDIGDYVVSYMDRTGVKPTIFIDYLQALRPLKEYGNKSIREAINATSERLCEIKNKYNLTMIVISSVSRQFYYQPLALDSAKESGNLEFDSDAVWFLELACTREDSFLQAAEWEKRKRAREAKKQEPRQMILKVEKSRFGGVDAETRFDYYAANDLFLEASGWKTATNADAVPFVTKGKNKG